MEALQLAPIPKKNIWTEEIFTVTSGSEKEYELLKKPIEKSEIVFLNGLENYSNIDYTINEKIITFVVDSILTPGDTIRVKYCY